MERSRETTRPAIVARNAYQRGSVMMKRISREAYREFHRAYRDGAHRDLECQEVIASSMAAMQFCRGGQVIVQAIYVPKLSPRYERRVGE